MKAALGFFRHLWNAGAFSPPAFVVRATIISILFFVSEILGLREYTTFLSGTSANLNVSWQTAATVGLIHLLLYIGFVLLVPIFLITAGLLTAWNRCAGRQQIPKGEESASAGFSVPASGSKFPHNSHCQLGRWHLAGAGRHVVAFDRSTLAWHAGQLLRAGHPIWAAVWIARVVG